MTMSMSFWGNDLAGRNEQVLAAAAGALARHHNQFWHVAFPWNRYQDVQLKGEIQQIHELEHHLEEIIKQAILAGKEHVITTYAGGDLDWAGEYIGRCITINSVFSCLLTCDFRLPAGQSWYPISLPFADVKALPLLASSHYRILHRIWQAVYAGNVPEVHQGSLLLPGNQILWEQFFMRDGHDTRVDFSMVENAAQLIAEEHGDQRCAIQILRTINSAASDTFVLDSNNLKLSNSPHLSDLGGRRNKIRIAYSLQSRHSHRTPLAYRQIADRCQHLIALNMPSSIAITGRVGCQFLGERSLCISEEPWWDLRFSGGVYTAAETGFLDGFFDNLPIPYYLAINPLVLDRLYLRMSLLANTPIDAILQRLLAAKQHYLGISELRLSRDKSGWVHPSLSPGLELRPLSHFRTKIGIVARARGLGTNHGKGWGRRGFQGLRRNAFIDWHLDKLLLIRSSQPLLGMAIENVHHLSYLTEKPFDMLCSGVVPITYASSSHSLHRYLEPCSHLNLYGLSLEQALLAIEHFLPTEVVAKAMQKSATRLACLFASSAALESTLDQVAERCEGWVLAHCRANSFQSMHDINPSFHKVH